MKRAAKKRVAVARKRWTAFPKQTPEQRALSVIQKQEGRVLLLIEDVGRLQGYVRAVELRFVDWANRLHALERWAEAGPSPQRRKRHDA